jgi:PAS domain S-box-containing protein
MDRAALQRPLADQLITERVIPAAAHLVLFGIVAVLIREDTPRLFIALWGGVTALVIGVRTGVTYQARRAQWPPGRIVNTMRVLLVILGVSWGTGMALAAQRVPLVTTHTLLLGLAGLLAGGLATLVADRWTFPLYTVAMFAPTLVGLLLLPERAWATMLLLMMFVLFTVRLHARSYQALVTRLTAERALRERDGQFAAAQAIAHVGSWEWDIPGNTVTWSDELRRMYGLGPEAPAGYAEWLALVHPDDRGRLEAVVADGLRTHQAMDYEWRLIRPDGSQRTVFGRNIVITDRTGTPTRMAGTSLDITERKQAEAELRAALQEVKTLRGYLRVCANCRRVRTEDGEWEQLESYVRRHSEAEFSHGICPDCAKVWT